MTNGTDGTLNREEHTFVLLQVPLRTFWVGPRGGAEPAKLVVKRKNVYCFFVFFFPNSEYSSTVSVLTMSAVFILVFPVMQYSVSVSSDRGMDCETDNP